jgi:hypothetical protein
MNQIRHEWIRARMSFTPLALVLVLTLASCGEEPTGGSAGPSVSLEPEAGGGSEEAAAIEDYEEPPVLEAKEILGAQLYQGPHYRVEDQVPNDGAMNHFRIHSDFGEFRVGSHAMLIKRLHEIEAIAALKEISSAEAVAGAAGEGAVKKVTAPVRGAKAVAHGVTHPREAWDHLSGASRGAMRVFGAASRHVQAGADNVGDVATGQQDIGSASREAVDRETGAAERVGSQYSGYGKYETKLMQQLGVDPYTDNQVLLDEIHRVAGLEAAVRVGFKFVPGIPGTVVLGQIDKFNRYAHNLELYQEPGKLMLENRRVANQMGIPPEIFGPFSGNENYNPAMQSRVLGAIHSMQGTADKENFFELAAGADDRSSAYFYVMMAEQLAEIHREEVPIVRLVAGVRIPAGMAEDGHLIVPLPVDHLVWSEEIAGVFQDSVRRVRVEDQVDVTYSELRIVGTVSDRARAGLEGFGMKVRSGVGA